MKLNKILLIGLCLVSCSSHNSERTSRKVDFVKYAEQIREEMVYYSKLQTLIAQEFARLPWEFLLQKYTRNSKNIHSVKFCTVNENASKLGWVGLEFDPKLNVLVGECITPVYSINSGRMIGYIKGKYLLNQSLEGFSKLKKAYIIDAENNIVLDPAQSGARKERKRHTLRERLPNTDGWRLSF